MPVKIYQEIKIEGKFLKSATYLPKGTLVTASIKENAEKLDKEMSSQIEKINTDFNQREKKYLNNAEKKWFWLGKRIDMLLGELKRKELITDLDITTDSIWPGISQYLIPELRRDSDKKRSGTHKDHLRKCWLFATLPDTDWFKNWSSWDAFIDRGEHLSYNGKLFTLLKNKIPNDNLSSRDYQKIAKILAGMFPQKSKNVESLVNISEKDLLEIIEQVRKLFLNHENLRT